jgi:hypothetical protein
METIGCTKVLIHAAYHPTTRANLMAELCHVMLLAMAVLNTPASAWVSVGQLPSTHSALHDQVS